MQVKICAKTVKARAPLRIGLGGGGTDVSSYCDQYGGLVLNATISKYVYVVINSLDGEKIRFNASDQHKTKTISIDEGVDLDGNLDLHVSVYRCMMNQFNNGELLPLELITFCEAPMGSGLGASSTLVVAMIKAFMEFFNQPLDNYSLAKLAFHIERVECGIHGGKQDQYSAAFGGFNFIEFQKNGEVIVNRMSVNERIISELEASLILFYTGVSRESGRIIAEQSSNIKNEKKEAIQALHRIKNEAGIMKDCLLQGDFLGIRNSMNSGWENKKQTAGLVSNSLIDEILEKVLTAGAQAGKISGAGGGGFMLIVTPVQHRLQVIKALNNYQGEISNCHFTKQGAQAWVLP